MFNQIRSGMKLNLIIQTKSPVFSFFVESAMDLAFEATYKRIPNTFHRRGHGPKWESKSNKSTTGFHG